MMIAPAGFMLKVSGSSIAIVAGGPRPGRTPTTVPRRTPTKHHSRLPGASATANPCSRPLRMSTLEAQNARGKRDAQREIEDQIEAGAGRERGDRGRCGGPPVHERDDEIREEREAQDEAEQLEQRDRDREREPHAERAADAPPFDRLAAARRASKLRADEQRRQREHSDSVPQREKPGAGPFGARVVPLPGLRDDVDAEQRERDARPKITRAPAGATLHASPPASLFLLAGLLVAVPGNDLAHRAAGRAELHRDHARIADDLAAVRADLLLRGREIVDFHGEVMDTGSIARGPRLGGLRPRVVLHDRQVDRAVGEVPRGVVAHLARLRDLETEDFLVELRGALEVVNLERDVNDAIHGISTYACSSRPSERTSLIFSMPQIEAHSFSERARPSTGFTRSRAFASTSARVIGFSGVPRTARVWCSSVRPSFILISTAPSLRGIAFDIASSPLSSTRLRKSSTFGWRMRASSCEDLKLTVPSSSITAHRCCMQMSGISRLSVVFAPRCATRTTTRSTSSARTRCARINSNSESRGAWMGEPTAQRLMSVSRTS